MEDEVSDRQQEVLNAIDATLSGYTDSDPISVDAMRWSPREGDEETVELEGGAKITFHSNGYTILDEHLYVEATGHLYPHPPRRPVDRFSFTRAAADRGYTGEWDQLRETVLRRSRPEQGHIVNSPRFQVALEEFRQQHERGELGELLTNDSPHT